MQKKARKIISYNVGFKPNDSTIETCSDETRGLVRRRFSDKSLSVARKGRPDCCVKDVNMNIPLIKSFTTLALCIANVQSFRHK